MSVYAIRLTRCALGWLAEANYAPGSQVEILVPPLFWRPSSRWAIRAARRRIARWERKEARQMAAEWVAPR